MTAEVRLRIRKARDRRTRTALVSPQVAFCAECGGTFDVKALPKNPRCGLCRHHARAASL